MENHTSYQWSEYGESTLRNLPVGIIHYRIEPESREAVCVYINPEALRINGLDEKTVIGMRSKAYLELCMYPEDREYMERIAGQFFAGTESVSFECRLQRPDGEIRWINGVRSWLSQGKVSQTVFMDVTDKKKMELQEEHTRNLLEKILFTTQTAIFWKDADRRFLGANKAFLDYYDFPSVSSILGKNDEDMGWHSDPDPYRNDDLKVIREGESTYRVPGMCISHGENRNIVASKSPLYEKGKIVGLVGSFEDVTEEVRQKEEISRLNGQLEKALEEARNASGAKSEFLARMSHDMRTPLTTIMGICDLLGQKEETAEVDRYIGTVRESAQYLLGILTDILDMQKLENGRLVLHPQICKNARSAKMIQSVIEPMAKEKGVRFAAHIHCDETECYPMVDVGRVQQIILNLLDNAVEYTPSGGTVIWDCRIEKETDDSITVVHTVSDDGPGIGTEFQQHMYEPFTQENNHTAHSGGSGLGLAIVKALVDLMHGSIVCRSAPGQGTSFTVSIPYRKAGPEEINNYLIQEAAEKAVPEKMECKILVCEDNDINADIIMELLKSRGISCERAVNGEDGVKKAQKKDFDAILMDIRMPVMDGYEATRKIRQFNRKIPIAALSANSFPEDIRESLASGMNVHLSKPVDTGKLFATISDLVGRDGPLHS